MKARPADGPPTAPLSMWTVTGNWNLIVSGGSGFGMMPRIVRPSSLLVSVTGTLIGLGLSLRADRHGHLLAGLAARERGADVGRAG